MGILYIILTCILIVNMILIKKSDKKQNILFWTVLSITITLIYNTIVSIIFTFINIKCTLLNLSIVNIIVIAILVFKIYKDKEIQKYFIKIKDIIFMILMLIVVLVVAWKQYGFPFQIKYETTDPAIHFSVAKEFYNDKKVDFPGGMPAAGINTGILFDIFDFAIMEEDFYCLYILFDLIILYLIGAMFYLGIANKLDSKLKSVIAMIFSILFVLGYPLNSMLFGYAYLSVAILFIIALIAVVPYVKNRELKEVPYCLILFILNFGIFFSYYLFIPVIYAALGLFMLFDMLKNRPKKNILSIFNKKNIIEVLTILILPTIIGFCYFILPNIFSSGSTGVSHIATEGYIYRDLYSNFIFLIPFVLYYVIDSIKNKENKFINICLIILVAFCLVLLKGGLRGEVSSYYYYKMYFVLSILMFYITTKAIFKMLDNKLTTFVLSYIFTIGAILIASISGLGIKIASINMLFNPHEYLQYYTDIYTFNYQKVIDENTIYTYNQIEAIDSLLKNVEDKKEVLLIGKDLQMLWARDLTEITDTKDIHELVKEKEVNIKEWLDNPSKKYLISLNKEVDLDENSKEYDIIKNDNEIVILKKK